MIDYVTQDPLIDNINEWLKEELCLIYTGHFKLYKEFVEDEPNDYGIGIEQGNFERPILIAGQFESDDKFLAYFKKEFKFKQLYRIPLFRLLNPQVDELDGPIFYDKQDENGNWIQCEAELVDNRQIRQIQNEQL